LLENYDKICLLLVLKISKVKLGGVNKMIEIPIGIDTDGEIIYCKTFGLDRRYNAITNRKLSVNQRAKIQNAREQLARQKGATVF
jgi:hypothetical protein